MRPPACLADRVGVIPTTEGAVTAGDGLEIRPRLLDLPVASSLELPDPALDAQAAAEQQPGSGRRRTKLAFGREALYLVPQVVGARKAARVGASRGFPRSSPRSRKSDSSFAGTFGHLPPSSRG